MLRLIRIAIQEALPQAASQTVLQLGDKGNWYLCKGEREQLQLQH